MYHALMRPVTPEDAWDVAELDALLFPDTSFNETTFATEIRSGAAWGIFIDHELAGYILIKTDGCITDIVRLGVRPSYQRRGFGEDLLVRALRETSDAMLTVKKQNRSALRLYLKYGFKIVGHLTENDAWVMRYVATSLGG